MKKFASIFALTVFATTQALKITETIGEQARIGLKLESKLGAPNILSITSEIQGVNSSALAVQQSISSSQSAVSSTITALSNSKQSIDQLVQQINAENISFSTIGSQLVSLSTNLASSLAIANAGSTNLTQASTQASSTTSQVSQLSSDYNNFLNGTDLQTKYIVTLQGCYLNGGSSFSNTYLNAPAATLQAAITMYQNWAVFGNNIGYWDKTYQTLYVVRYDLLKTLGLACYTAPSQNPWYAVLIPMMGGIITQF